MTPNWGVNDYQCDGHGPPFSCDSVGDSYVDSCGQCTSFVNWRLAQAGLPGLSGNASNFGNSGRAMGWPVDQTPTADSIFVFPPGCYGAGAEGHTGVVLDVSGSTIHVEQYNFNCCGCGACGWCLYSQSNVTLTGCGAEFVHPPWSTGPPPPPPDPCTGVQCGPCQTCQGGACVDACPAGYVCANGECVVPIGPGPAPAAGGIGVGTVLLLGLGAAGAGLGVYLHGHPEARSRLSSETARAERSLRRSGRVEFGGHAGQGIVGGARAAYRGGR